MLRLFLFLGVVVVLATGLAWLADRPGDLVIDWQGYLIETSVFRAVVLLTLLVGLVLFSWSLLRNLWASPAAVGNFLSRRRQKRGLEALSSGMIAVGAGDRGMATRYAIQARKSLPNEPLTHLLRAQAAQLSGDKATARRIFEAMLGSPDTEQLGLRGLFLEAEREGETEAAKQFAERAIRLNAALSWPVDALFDLQCKEADWSGALETLAIARKSGQIEKASASRRRAVLLTAQAQAAEDGDPERALARALEAHALAPGLVPAAAIAGRLLASRGNTPRATKVIQTTWQKSPHPDLATAYAYARLGDSPRDRLERVKKLAALNPYSLESPIAVAVSAIEAKDYDAAREALEPLLESRLTQRVCTLMARIEGEQHGDKGRVREWLARAVNSQRDPAWTADGVVSETWAPVSPVSGALDAFQWRVPVENIDKGSDELLAMKLEELVALGAAREDQGDNVIAAEPKPPATAAKPSPKGPVADADVIEDATVQPQAGGEARSGKPDATSGGQASSAAPAQAGEPAAGTKTASASDGDDARLAARSTTQAKPATAQGAGKPVDVAEPEIFVPPRAPDDPGPPGTTSAKASTQWDVNGVPPRTQRA